jgi:hypothetical protein
MAVRLTAMRRGPPTQDGLDGFAAACVESVSLLSTSPKPIAALDCAREQPAFDLSGDHHSRPASSHGDARDRPLSSRIKVSDVAALTRLGHQRVERFANLPARIPEMNPETQVVRANEPTAPVVRLLVRASLASP